MQDGINLLGKLFTDTGGFGQFIDTRPRQFLQPAEMLEQVAPTFRADARDVLQRRRPPCLAAPRIAQPTEYRLEMAGRLLGLRKFIEESELPRIRALAAENPEYFYDVLPYASVFGLEEEWAGRFDGMAVPPPVWYGCSDMTVWNVIWFSHMMHHSVDHSMTQLQQTVAQQSGGSSGGGGSFGGSGGGFSGGGFGGGGGGRW